MYFDIYNHLRFLFHLRFRLFKCNLHYLNILLLIIEENYGNSKRDNYKRYLQSQ